MKRIPSPSPNLFAPLAGLALAGCSVYAPMQPTISGVREAGQIEASASIQANARLEAGVVAAPVPHLLVAGAGCYRPRIGGSDTYFGTRQWEAAVGTYVPLGPKGVLSGLVGYGYADSERKSTEVPLFGSATTADLRARCNTSSTPTGTARSASGWCTGSCGWISSS